MSGTLISSLTWIPRGRASTHPKKYSLDENEIERVGKMGGEGVLEKLRQEMEAMDMKAERDGDAQGDDAADDGDWQDESSADDNSDDDDDEETSGGKKQDVEMSDADDMAKYNLDNYDEEESRGIAMGAFSNIRGLTFYRDNNEDPYINLKDAPLDEDEDDREALEIRPTDSLLLTARTSEDLSSLDYHVYDEPNENLYVHHDLMLPSFPLCVEWLDFPAGGPSGEKTHGNYIAVGTFDPAIEIWDMDVLDGLYPEALLGPSPSMEQPEAKPKGTGKKKKKIMQKPKSEDYHTEGVTSLSWTSKHRNLLLSASADQTVKLWDLTRASPQKALRSWDQMHPGEKVLGVEWNQHSSGEHSTVVLSAGERTVKVWDSRAAQDGLITGSLGSDTECIRWDPWNAMDFFVSLENGLILCYDARTLSNAASAKPKYTISAHDGPASALDVNPHVRGCIATGGMDKVVKVWNVNEEDAGKRDITLVTARDLGVGKVFTVRFSPDSPLTLAAAGSLAKVQVWDVASNAGARQAFGHRLRQAGKELAAAKEGAGVIGVADDDDEDDSEADE